MTDRSCYLPSATERLLRSIVPFLEESMRKTLVVGLFAVASLLVFPLAARAQGLIAGSVRDPSGAVLPGVTVEAASPALIEKTRSAVSDGAGQYKIVDLPPGTYTVAFTLTGFKTV